MSFFPVIVSVYVFTNASICPAVVQTLIRLKRLILNCKLKFKLAWVHITLLNTTADSTIFLVMLPFPPIIPHLTLHCLHFLFRFIRFWKTQNHNKQRDHIASLEKKCFHSFYSRHMVKYTHNANCWKSKQNHTRPKPRQISADNILYDGLVVRKWFIAWLCCRLKYGKWLSMLNSVDELLTFFPTHILYFCTWRKYTWNCTAKRWHRKGVSEEAKSVAEESFRSRIHKCTICTSYICSFKK